MTIVDLPGEFLCACNDKDVIMLMRGILTETLTVITQKTYKKYVTVERGQKVLYVKVQKAFYGIIRSVLQFNRKLKEYLEKAGFIINPNDLCITNKMVNGSQMVT